MTCEFMDKDLALCKHGTSYLSFLVTKDNQNDYVWSKAHNMKEYLTRCNARGKIYRSLRQNLFSDICSCNMQSRKEVEYFLMQKYVNQVDSHIGFIPYS